ncbi:MAG: transporter substrate-binding domain-containing protein, partial [Gemmatimonadetes bacterium]|nr:transporter substrate-binding domain-containing protein [Gemmatimonadota bacterium]
ELGAVVVASVREDDAPISGAMVEFARSIAGQAAEYAWSGMTDEEGRVRLEIVGDATGYYQARASQDGRVIGVWSSIPINAGDEVMVNLPIGGRAQVMSPSSACADRVLNFGFFAFFAPVSSSADPDPNSAGFNTHVGYEADLLTALEAMDGAGLSFSRKGIDIWPNIWLLSAGVDYDVVGGGITILDSRTRDEMGNEVVTFTSGHIAFRQSLLVRAEDGRRWVSHDDLTSEVRVGVLASTTGEARLLVLTGLVNADGVLAAGVRIETQTDTVVADGSADYFITAAGASPNLEGRQRIFPAVDTMPQVVYLGEEELLGALASGRVDALARGEIGNRDAVHASGGAFVVTALDAAVEYGGFTLGVEDADLAACIDDKINYLTDDQRIGYGEWRQDPSVFMTRARMWQSR